MRYKTVKYDCRKAEQDLKKGLLQDKIKKENKGRVKGENNH